MQKIPTMFVRDEQNRSRVLDEIAPGCEWVAAGEGIATGKIDGTSCMVRAGKLFKRREIKGSQQAPEGFEVAGYDPETAKTVGWVAVSDTDPEDAWHREAFRSAEFWDDGTYELIGPKVQGNPEGVHRHRLVRHGHGLAGELAAVPRDFNGLKELLFRLDIEGIVFHHSDGRRAKIKARDFGFKRANKTDGS